MAPQQSYKVGGSLDGDNAFYVARAADQELFTHLKACDTCFVFNSRQMGKSSLRVRTMQRLRQEGVVCAVIDPQSRGTTPTEEQWYAGTLKRLIEDLGLAEAVPFSAWWKEGSVQALSAVNRFEEFIDKILLAQITAPIVLFVEEVDNLLSLSFDTDGFFGMIRSLHERRSEQPAYKRLGFCFLGVATPYDLIRSGDRSAFNIGHAVELSGLERREAEPLLAGLDGKVDDPAAVLDAVLQWSGGQPFLTQKLLALLSAAGGQMLPEGAPPRADRPAAELVAAVTQAQIIRNWEAQDSPVHLRTIRDRLLQGDERHRGRLLGMVQRIQEQGAIPADSSREQMQLRLTGLVVPMEGQLRLYNPIYAAVFTPEWVRAQLQELRPTIYAQAINDWEKALPAERATHLIGGAALLEALEWAKDKSLSPADQEFLEASDAAAESAIRAAEAIRLAEERARVAEREARMRRKVILAMAGALVAFGGLSAFAWHQLQVAQLREQAALVINEARTAPVEALIRAIALRARASESELAGIERSGDDSLAHALSQGSPWGEVDRLLGHQGGLRAIALSPDGRRMVSASIDRTLRLWNVASGQPIGPPLLGHSGTVRAVAFSPDGRRIVSGSSDTTLRIWDGFTGSPIGAAILGNTGPILSVAFSPDGRQIVSGAMDKTVRLWDAANGKSLAPPLLGHLGVVRAVAFSPDGRTILSGSSDNSLRLWDATSGRPIGRPLLGHTDTVSAAAFSPDGRRIVSGSFDKSLRLWDAATGTPLGSPHYGHRDWVRSVAFSSDGKSIVTGSADGTLLLWDGLTGNRVGQPLKGHTGSVDSVAFLRDGRSIVSGSIDRSVRLWDATTGQTIDNVLKGPKGMTAAVAFSPNGSRIVTGLVDNSLQFWDAASAAPIGKPLRGHTLQATSVAFSPDGRRLVSGSQDNTLRLWDVSTGKQIAVPELLHRDSIVSVAFSADGRRIASGSLDYTVRLWDGRNGQPIGKPLQGHGSQVRSVTFSPDGRLVVSGSGDSTLRLWDVATGRQIGPPLQGHDGEVLSVAFSPDGRQIVSGSSDRSLRLWDVATGKPIGVPLQVYSSPVIAVAFSPNGRLIRSISKYSRVLLWDSSSHKPITTAVQGLNDSVEAAAFSPNGSRVVAIFSDSSAHLLNVTPMGYVTLACQRLGRHQLLRNPKGLGAGPEFEAIAARARKVCANSAPPPPLTMAVPGARSSSPQARDFALLQLARPLHWLRHSMGLS